MLIRTLAFQRPYTLLLIPLIALMVLTVSRDVYHFITHQYSFYLSESLLFGAFWPLFPLIAIISKQISFRFPYLHTFLVPITLTILHVAIFGLLVFASSCITTLSSAGSSWTASMIIGLHTFWYMALYNSSITFQNRALIKSTASIQSK